MVIHERSVTKVFWQTMRDYINRRCNHGRYERVGRTNVYHVFGTDHIRTYAIFDGDDPVSWVYLYRRPSWRAWEVRQVFTMPDFRGQGLAAQIYKVAVNHENLMLAAGKTQSKSSRALWKRFIAEDTFTIWAQDFNDLSKKAPVEVIDDEVYCKLKLYEQDFCSKDVRFIAVKRK